MLGEAVYAAGACVVGVIWFWVIAPELADRAERRRVARLELERAQARFKAAMESAHQQLARQPWEVPTIGGDYGTES